ncbi:MULTISPECIES: DUF397 domain-containing protein [unclassified Streptomyces]|uniref:DUF397 domain-containing protein n=1 Tax=unclassified Streptomyces TaxID=2593676 RepID=UPI000939667A|nr:DUF397 domain-containing protein [Streptomyces sp. TSRI0281]OKI46537.1 hypothetical protein A6A29_27240 [Streptomyces sp. TSRI0281]
MKNLYRLPAADDSAFANFCGGNLQSEHESCIDVAAIPGAAEAFAVRDSKPEGSGKELRFTAQEMDDFALGWAQQRGLAL